jgi:methionyl-tRNA formyltransferase
MSVLRVALIRADDHHHRYLESLLRSRFAVRISVVEPGRERVRRLRRRGAYRDWAYHVYHHYRRLLTGKDRYRRRYFAHEPRLWQVNAPDVVRVRSVNGADAVAALRAATTDVTVIIGCSILRQPALDAAGPLIINVHGGFLPYYRGNHCFFFAVRDRRFDRVGSSVHRVDAGIDTGGQIEVVRPPLTGRELPEHLYCRADFLAINRLVRWLEDLEGGRIPPTTAQPAVGHTYRTRDRGPVMDMGYFLRRRAGLIRRARRINPADPENKFAP